MDNSTLPALIDPKASLKENIQGDAFREAVTRLRSKYVTADRMMMMALNAINRTPDLVECTQPSVMRALMRLSEVGLEPDGYHAHIVAYNNKVKGSSPPKYRKEAQLIIDYKGLVTVIRRNPAIAVVKGAVVYEHDKFIYREGSDRYFEHEPAWVEGDEIKGAYSFVKFANINDWELNFVPLWHIKDIKNRSKAKDYGPWVTDFAQMCIKTAIRQHAKMLPLTAEEQRATLLDDDVIETEDDTRRLPQKTAEFRAKSASKLKSPAATPDDADMEDTGESPSSESETESSSSAPVPDPAEEQKKVREEFSKSFDKLWKLMEVKGVTDAELLFILGDFQKDIGDGVTSVADLPYATVKDVIKNWGTYEFEVIKLRKADQSDLK